LLVRTGPVMKRALIFVGALAAGLVVALVVRLIQLRSAGDGPPGGSGVIEGVDVDVTSRIAARIVKVDVREGDVVTQDQPLVELDCTDQTAALAQAHAAQSEASAALDASRAQAASAGQSASAATSNIAAAKSQLAVLEGQERLANIELGRTQTLADSGAVTKAELDTARTTHDTLLSQIAAQRAAEIATRDQAGAARTSRTAATSEAIVAERKGDVAAAAVSPADRAVRECTLLAPRAGMIATRVHEPGEPVQPGTVVLTITDLSEARTRFYLPNAELASAAPGGKVRVVADAYPGTSFEGTIFYVSPRAEFTPRNVQTREDRERLVYAVEVRIPNQDMRLRSGMPVEVAIEGSGSAVAR
jgi:HlyD family secretion protein